MKNIIDQLAETDPEFHARMLKIKQSTNYFVAVCGASADETHAINLCMAMAYDSGKQAYADVLKRLKKFAEGSHETKT